MASHVASLVDLRDLIDVIAVLCDDENLVVCFKETLKGAGLAATGAAVFGMLLGPVGLAIGGTVGGTTAALLSRGKFQPVSKVLRNMSEDKWRKLYAKLRHAFRNFHATDAAALVTLIVSGQGCEQLAITVVKNFLTSDLSGTVKSQ